MRPLLLLAALLAALAVCEAHRGHHRALLDDDWRSERDDGRVFNFRSHGGASRFLDSLPEDKLDRIKSNSQWEHSREELDLNLDQDEDMGVDPVNEALLFQCTGLVVNSGTIDWTTAGAAVAAGEVSSGVAPGDADPPTTNAFLLSSRPSALRKIYLNFKGGNVTNSAWNSKSAVITIPPYDKDGVYASFSSQELSDIVAIWRAVAEDYSAFDVDITTVPPTPFVPQFHLQVMIGGDGAWYGPAGGVSYVGIFGRNDTFYQPTFVFPKQLGPDYAKYVWESTSHEVGHALGLVHDGVAGTNTTYYRGQGDWAPIMGVGYYKIITQFDKGEYANSDNPQDDFAVINTKLPYIASENGNGFGTARLLAATASGATTVNLGSGVVTAPGVADYFSFFANAGTATLTVTVPTTWASSGWARSNLDVVATVYTSAGTAVATINPVGSNTVNGLGISGAVVTLPAAGTYYVAITGAGAGDPLTTGYSRYGSRGQFSVNVTAPTYTGPALQTIVANATSRKVYNKTSKTYTCTSALSVRFSNGTVIASKLFTSTWSTPIATPGYPYTINATLNTRGNSASTAPSLLPTTSGGCTYSVGFINLVGWAMDPTSVLIAPQVW